MIFFGDEFGDALDEVGFVDLVGDLGDNDGLAAAADLFEAHFGAHDEPPPARPVGLGKVAAAIEVAAGGEIGAP